ncbi:MAG: hypothetical protein U1E60_19660 [Reyranellaceae bacterium]
MLLQRIRLAVVVISALGAGACAGSNPADLIPVGLRASIAAEDKAAQKGPDAKAVSVDEMLSKVRGGKLPPPTPLPSGSGKAGPADGGVTAPASDGAAETVAVAPASPSPAPPSVVREPAAAPGSVHPLWASFNTQARPATTAGDSTEGTSRSEAPPLPPLPVAPNSVIVRFAGTTSDLTADERARLDAAVTLHKATTSSARIVAGPPAGGAPFEKLLVAEKRSQAVDQALPESLVRTRDYSPRIEADTVRVEFATGSR